jgi:Nucleotidyl transferase AbiEii toxin, Type IV TA system
VLTPLQERVARIVAALPAADGFALAGGAALVALQIVDRETRDLDFFGAATGDVAALADAAGAALAAEGLAVAVQASHAGFARLEVSDGQDATELDLGVDARIRPAEPGPLGPTLALEELAADKLLALFGRAQARDFVDVAALAERLGFEELCRLAAEKDPGFSRRVLADMLAAFGRYTADDLDVDTAGYRRLADAVATWRRAIVPGG